MSTKFCQICGEKSGIYPLCKEHLEMKNKGDVIKNEKTGLWELANKPQEDQENIYKQSKCIICGKDSNEFLFCKDCYYKYKDKELLVKITKCSTIKILDDTYEGKYTCEDGHIVKSKSEREIDDYLFRNKIPHAYEQDLPIDDKEEHNLHPDFTLPNFDNGEPVYIEHWGYDESNANYQHQKEYKLSKYKQLKVTVICTNEKNDSKDINSALKRKLKFFKSGTINYND